MTWVPESCTLPTVEQPLRVAEFDHLFTETLRGVECTRESVLRLVLEPEAEQRARELAAKESECCTFFTFAFARREDGRVVMEVAASDAYRAVVAALAERARAGIRAQEQA